MVVDPNADAITDLICNLEIPFTQDVTLRFSSNMDGTSTLSGTIVNRLGGDLPGAIFWKFTIHEFGDTTQPDISSTCANIGDEINVGSIDNTGLDGTPLGAGATYTFTQTDFDVPLEDILGHSIFIAYDVSDPPFPRGCCVLGKAAKPAVVLD